MRTPRSPRRRPHGTLRFVILQARTRLALTLLLGLAGSALPEPVLAHEGPTAAQTERHRLLVGVEVEYTRGSSVRDRFQGTPERSTDDLESGGLFPAPTLRLSWLMPLIHGISVGAHGAYRPTFELHLTPAEGEDEGTSQSLGSLYELGARAEYPRRLGKHLALVLGTECGPSLVAAGGALQDRIDVLKATGYDTWSGPRMGLHLSADLAARWQVLHWLSVRGGIKMLWRWSWLLDSTAETASVVASDTWTVDARELSPNLDLELSF